ncbi:MULTISPECIES: hypothetical protein [Rhizobium]|uniref:hypothetical protein n=1 Tax=Rhizobium TaxID=379 RepID=UPI0019543AE7|nr:MULTISPECIES: hypothetical protein [Rhizobium]MCA2436648.1 hypothetical protein [Rhizobium leguminosarum]
MTTVTLSELRNDAELFLAFKRAMGHPYRRGAFEIERFLRFVGEQWAGDDDIPLADAISAGVGVCPTARPSRSAMSSASFASFACIAVVVIPPAMCPSTLLCR